MLEIRQLQVSYGAVTAVRGFDLSVQDGEFIAILGANGAGKTSIMRGLMGIASHRADQLAFRDDDMRSWKTRRRVAEGMTLVPEGREIFPRMTVVENLKTAYDAKARHGRTEAECSERTFELFPRLAERRRQLGGTMSGGEQQMLAIGRGLMQEPRLLLLDEPSLGLAPIVIDLVMDALTALNQQGLTLLMVEQDATRALDVSDRVVVIRNGSTVMEGSSAELAGSDDLRDAIFGHAPHVGN
jgi:branched-chain amino acid transport system ATP-binding protein